MGSILTLTMNPAIDVSASVETVSAGEKLRCGEDHRDPGGGGINVARVVARMGGDVLAVFPSGGPTGQLLQNLVSRERVASLAIPVSQDTREDVTIFERTSGKQFRFVFPGPHLSDAEWRACIDALETIRHHPSYLVISGTLPQDAPESFFGAIVALATKWKAKVVLDTSGPQLRRVITQGVFLCKPNREEMQELTGLPLDGPAHWKAACLKLIKARQTEVVAMTLGAEGALLATNDFVLRALPIRLTPKTTVGAGDSFLGALIWGLDSGQPMETAFRLGMAAGSAALLGHGTALCAREDVYRLLPQVTIERL